VLCSSSGLNFLIKEFYQCLIFLRHENLEIRVRCVFIMIYIIFCVNYYLNFSGPIKPYGVNLMVFTDAVKDDIFREEHRPCIFMYEVLF
jgi:hypothetical protein